MKVRLPYGKTGLEVEVPEDATVLLPEQVPPLPDPVEAIRQALASPIGSRPLQELVKPGDSVAIVFSDITRPTPNHIILPVLLEQLLASGIARQDITLINGLGMHRPNTREELETLLGRDILEGYRLIQHDATDQSQLSLVGKSSRGVEAWINVHYLRSAVKILTGFVEPHIFAGWSGGGKAVLPSVAGADAIISNHSGPMIAHPRATWCVGEGNPIFQEMREVALATQPTFLLNVTLDQEKRITGVFAGELVAAHDAGIDFARRVYIRPLPHEYDIAVTSQLGYPSDINLYQAMKGLSVAARAVRPGGAIILAAECADGLGLPHFRHLLDARDSPQALLEMIVDPSFRAYDQWGVQCLAMSEVKADCYLHAALSAEDVGRAHLKPAPDISQTLATLVEAYRGRNGGREPRVLVLPYGQLTVPQLPD